MRIGNCIVLALMLGVTADVCGQTGTNPQMVPPNVVKDASTAPVAAPPTNAAQPSSASVIPAVPFINPDGFGDDMAAPANAVPQLFWFRADYMLSWVRKEDSPPLIQAIPGSFANAATVPSNAANTLFPTNDKFSFGNLNGVRINTGMWLTDDHSWGIDVTGFVTSSVSTGAAYSSPGAPILTRFYNNANSGAPSYLYFSSPSYTANGALVPGYSGALSASETVKSIYSGDINFRYNGYRILTDNTDYLFGFRYFNFRESLQINGVVNLPAPNAQTLHVSDQFSVNNNFYGAQFGFDARWVGWRNFSLDGIVKFAAGSMNETASISGSNSITTAAGTTTQPTGLYAQPTNIGNYQRDKFAVIPQVTLNINYNFTQRSAIFIGWNYLWVSNVVRAASVIDPNVSDSNIRYIANPTPGNAPAPEVVLRGQALWMQGINFGYKFEY